MVDAFSNPKLIEEAWIELKKRRVENFKYEPLIGDRKPALDYRK
jgi:aminobenzoyl-glutamate utilization protein B